MGRPIPVPANALYSFPRLADDILPVPVGTSDGFPFFKYLLLSVSAGVITHYVIRGLEKRR